MREMTMRALKVGMEGQDVKKWQSFLASQGFYRGEEKEYGPETRQGTVDFQRAHELKPPTGAADNRTVGLAMQLGFLVVEDG